MLLFTMDEKRTTNNGTEKHPETPRSLSGYKRKVSRSMRAIRQAYKRAQTAETGINRISIKWVLTNHYAIDESYRTVFQNLNPRIKVPAVRLSGRKIPRICHILQQYLEDYDYMKKKACLHFFILWIFRSLRMKYVCCMPYWSVS